MSVNWHGLQEEVLHRLFTKDRSVKKSWTKLEFLEFRKLSKHFKKQIDYQVKIFKPASLLKFNYSILNFQNVEIADFTSTYENSELVKIQNNVLTNLEQFQKLQRIIVFENQVNYLSDLLKIQCFEEFIVEVKGLTESRFQVICLFLQVLKQKSGDISKNLKFFQLEVNLPLEKITELLDKSVGLPVKFNATISHMENCPEKLDNFYNQWGTEDQIVGLNCFFCPDVSPREMVIAAQECPSLKYLAVTLTEAWCGLRNDEVVCFNQLQDFQVSSPCIGYESGVCALLSNGLTKLDSLNLYYKNSSMEQFLYDIKSIAKKVPNLQCLTLGNLHGSKWLDSITNFRNLKELCVDGFNFQSMGNQDEFLKLGQLKSLRSLKLRGCGGELPPMFPTALQSLTMLEELEICLFKNRFTQFGALFPLIKLKRLLVECVDPEDLQENVMTLLELRQLRYIDFKLRSPYLLDCNQQEAVRLQEEIQQFLKQVLPNIRKIDFVVVRKPQNRILN